MAQTRPHGVLSDEIVGAEGPDGLEGERHADAGLPDVQRLLHHPAELVQHGRGHLQTIRKDLHQIREYPTQGPGKASVSDTLSATLTSANRTGTIGIGGNTK